MRLLKYDETADKFSLTEDLHGGDIPPYAILSHTWGLKADEVVLKDIVYDTGDSKAGFAKLRFCAQQARSDGLDHFWIDTCCIDQANNNEVSEAIISMFRWYRNAARCYAYLADVSIADSRQNSQPRAFECESAFRASRWFTRGWTLQELLAPATVEFFTCEGRRLGNKGSLKRQLQEITGIPIAALENTAALSQFDVEERFKWAERRQTTREEDQAYSLLGIFGVYMPAMYGEGEENAKRRLRKEIRDAMHNEDASGYQEASNVHFYVPRTTNSLFTGRQEVISQISRAIRETSSITQQRRFVITGIGGLGKSELCLNIANQVRKAFWGIFWIDVSSGSTASTAFAMVAQLLGSTGKGVDDALHSLSNTGDKRNWLLILDNADDPDRDYSQYLPSSALGAVLITSRNPRCSVYSTVGSLELSSLDEEDCINLLLKAVGTAEATRQEMVPAVRSVIKTLNYHTLALLNAGAYINDGHCSIADYPAHYHSIRELLLKFSPAQMQSRYSSIYATFEVSAHALERSRAEAALDALCLLEVFSTLHYENIPLDMFQDAWYGARRAVENSEEDKTLDSLTRWHVSRLPQFLRADSETWDSFRLSTALGRLQSLGLIKRNKVKDFWTLSMHPLTHHWVKERQDHTELQVRRRQITSSSILALCRYSLVTWRPFWAYLGPHLLGIASQFSALAVLPQELLQILLQIDWLFQELRLDRELAVLLSQIFRVCGADPEVPREEILPLYSLASLNKYCLGDIKTATRVQRIVVRIQDGLLDRVHPTRMEADDILAALYFANGQVNDTILLLEQIVVTREAILHEAHHSRLASQHALATAYCEGGQVEKAVKLLEYIVRVRESLAKTHPDRLASQHELAIAYRKDGQVEKSIKLLEHIVRVKESLAETHPDRLGSQHELSIAYREDGQVEKAVNLMEHVARVRKETLTETHYDRLASQAWLESVYFTRRC